jgi:predicted DNA-binding protein
MKRTSIFVPDQMVQRLKRASEKTGLGVSELIRTAINAYLREMKL